MHVECFSTLYGPYESVCYLNSQSDSVSNSTELTTYSCKILILNGNFVDQFKVELLLT